MRWIEGYIIISYIEERTPLKIDFERMKRALSSGLKREEIFTFMDAVETNPIYLPRLSRAETFVTLKLIKDALISLTAHFASSEVKQSHEGALTSLKNGSSGFTRLRGFNAQNAADIQPLFWSKP